MMKIHKQGWLKPASAVVLAVSSLAVVVSAVRMGVYSMIGPSPGLFPTILASLLGLLTIIWLFTPEPHADTEPATRNGLTSVSTVIGDRKSTRLNSSH